MRAERLEEIKKLTKLDDFRKETIRDQQGLSRKNYSIKLFWAVLDLLRVVEKKD